MTYHLKSEFTAYTSNNFHTSEEVPFGKTWHQRCHALLVHKPADKDTTGAFHYHCRLQPQHLGAHQYVLPDQKSFARWYTSSDEL